MPPQNTVPSSEQKCPWYQPLCTVTPFSKYLALVIFIALPFMGAYVGYQIASERVVEIPIAVSNNSVDTPLIEVSQEAAETMDEASEYQGMITLSFNSDSVDTSKLDISQLMIQTSPSSQISQPINLTGWTLESKQVMVPYTLSALTLTASKYTSATSTNSTDIVFNPFGSEYVSIKIDKEGKDNFIYPSEGGDTYRFSSKIPLWAQANDTITLRDSAGKIVSVFQY